MELSTEFVALLSCPVTGDNLDYNRDEGLLLNKKAGLAYPIIDGIPLLLESEAKKL